ncbi:endonuclease/exonuclease/phosphatase family protein [Aureibaculum sp. 2210JD6-5]|uniref:endonuclease/exonuclease/phosphatase family protein n=1 Tax=Aureibaculum sp. 2210JD6-5 TaxID=3103957 RepID=UPI002AAD6A5D|nr:endonuclease/exonuclease/phosphatase family protein [Aureibaculum sp. 2210JD6-5]MDY7394635.1 endonuclease/exonuclease/phosphatase family protein [Aureibaculum sp. 2210JD6-5]
MIETKNHNLYTIAFYNLENLFDITNTDKVLDRDYTPTGKNKWNKKRYHRKLKLLSRVIAEIGKKETGFSPAIIGIAEVENKQVINDLLSKDDLKDKGYKIVHFDSPDERGVDVALLYRPHIFELINAESLTLLVDNFEGIRDQTRDILLVKGKLQGKLIYFFINHWPSRREDGDTNYKRIQAAELIHRTIEKIKLESPNPNIIIMGDFNDDPTSTSIKQHLVTGDFYNPYESLFSKGFGSMTYRRQWHLFDQIILSKNLINSGNFNIKDTHIFDPEYLKEWKGKHKGRPFRTYIGPWFQGGYSDHFPVYVMLEIEKTS